jgi:hypothetical protein
VASTQRGSGRRRLVADYSIFAFFPIKIAIILLFIGISRGALPLALYFCLLGK